MCVIVYCEKVKPTDETLWMMEQANPDGIGLMWSIGRWNYWFKSQDLDGARQMIDSLSVPFVIHFRLATAGSKSMSLCHPFEVGHFPSEATAGKTQKPLMMHNGHITNWEFAASCLGVAVDSRWSDSRLFAAALARNPMLLKRFDDGKLAFLHRNRVRLHGTYHPYEGMQVSNTYFDWSPLRGFDQSTVAQSGYCEEGYYWPSKAKENLLVALPPKVEPSTK